MEPPGRTSAVVKGANYLSHLGICTQRSKSGKGSIFNRNDIKYGKVDEAYAYFLGWESQFIEKEDEDDPTYMMFLDDLKECGNGYMLGVSIENGLSFPIKYEVEDDPLYELEKKTPRSRGSLIQERKSLDLDNVMQSHQKDSVYVTTKRRRLDVNDELNSGHRNSGLAKENFLRRSSRITQNYSYSQRSSEVNLNVSGDLRTDLQRQDTPSRTLLGKRQKSLVGISELNSSLKNPSFEKINSTGHNSRVMQNSMDAKKANPAVICIPHSKADTVDKSYGGFVARLRVVGEVVYYECPDGNRIYYDEPQMKSPTPQPPTRPPRLPTPPPRAQTDKDDSHTLSKPKKVVNNSKAGPRDYSEFWEAVKKDLRRPFEQKEYEDLLECVKARKPIGVHKETRSGGYTTEFLSRLGASYLDSFPDLKHEIEKAKSDRSKVLNLLRGFVFYLQKLPQGVPKPWKNEECKKIMPKTRCA